MKPIKRVVAVTGTYTDRSGNEKKRYANVGTLFQYDDGGQALKLESVPVGGGWDGWLRFYDLDERKPAGDGAQTRRAADLDDEIPF